MSNRNYRRSADRERRVMHELEAQGWYAIRAAGSHGIADVIAIKPRPDLCADPYHFEVRFIQIKVSERLRTRVSSVEVAESVCGPINVEFWKFPVRVAKKGGAR